jgi:hypothetical protein
VLVGLELSSFKMGYSSIICMIMGFKCLYHRQGSFDIVYGVCRLICGPNAAIVIKKADLVITDVEHIDTTSDDGSYFLKVTIFELFPNRKRFQRTGALCRKF